MYAWLFSGAASELASGIDWDAWATKEPGPDDLFPSSPFEYELDLIIGAPSCSPCFDFSVCSPIATPVL